MRMRSNKPTSCLVAVLLITLSTSGSLGRTAKNATVSPDAGNVPQKAQSGIPARPEELKYSTLTYTPPKRDKYRHVLSNGVVAYLVEDHDLPLVNLSLTVRTGSYLEPQGKEGLASLTGSQMRGRRHDREDCRAVRRSGGLSRRADLRLRRGHQRRRESELPGEGRR